MKKLTVWFVNAACMAGLLVGCGGGGDDGTVAGGNALSGGGAPAASAAHSPTAASTAPAAGGSQHQSVSVSGTSPHDDSTDTCTASGDVPLVVMTGDPNVTTNIQSALGIPGFICDGHGNAEVKASVEMGFQVGANGQGIFSIDWTMVVFDGGHDIDEHVHSFELQTGKELKYGDVLEQAGIDKVHAACVAGLMESDFAQFGDQAIVQACNSVASGSPLFIKNEGIQALPDLPAAAAGAITVPVVTWKQLAGTLKAVVTPFANAHP